MYIRLLENAALFTGVFFLFEAIALIVFKKIREKYHPAERHLNESIFKGMLERLLILFGLINDIPTVLIFFGAIKLGTRLKPDTGEQNEKTHHDYFLIGNITSVLLALFAYSFYLTLNG
jgi:hypothetical protein